MDIEMNKRIKELRIKHGYKSRQALAAALHVDLSVVKSWERDKRPALPKMDNLLAMCDLFKCDLDYLTGRLPESTHDIHFVHEYTGLSESAIKILSAMKDYKEPNKEWGYSTVLSWMICTYAFSKLLREAGFLSEIPGYYIGDFLEECTPYRPEGELNYREVKEFYITRLLIDTIEEMRQPITEREFEQAVSDQDDIWKITTMGEMKAYFKKRGFIVD